MLNDLQLQSPFLQELYQRGFIYQSTNLKDLDVLLCKEKITAYVGFDCTAKSLHVGSLMQIMIMRKLQQHGHKPIILLGGATTKIGDPSDKDNLRKMLSTEEIETNKDCIVKIFHKFLNFTNVPNKAEIVNNEDWLQNVKYIDFLQNYGIHFSINRMLTLDSVKNRLERQSPLTFLEFNYMILQAYDFLELYKTHNCRLQFGGSEQWSNIINGIELARKVANAELFGITTPLITTSNGAKMGKTLNGAVWLNNDMLSSYEYWQFWRNTPDEDVIKFMKLYTEISLEEIAHYDALYQKNSAQINDLKKILATEATAMCHCSTSAQSAKQLAEDTFELKTINSLPSFNIHCNTFLYKILVDTKFTTSNSEAKKLIAGKGVKLNDITVENDQHIVQICDMPIKLSIGKKKHIILKNDDKQ